MKKIFLYTFFLFLYVNSHAQTYPPCTNGTQAVCKCSTAPLLCTIDELDGYVLTMSNYQHAADGPSPMCPGNPTSQTNNPTWFKFKAWCTSLTLQCTASACSGGNGTIQIAVYSGCPATVGNNVACDVSVANCNQNVKTIAMTGLTIGATYWFMVDGCGGAACTVTIDVVGTCGSETIEDWKGPITGATEICAPKTETYTIQTVNGATHYIWYLDGVIVKNSTANTYTKSWTTPGVYTLCVDAYNDPCIPVTNFPPQTCITINVEKPDNGTLTAAPTPVCPDAPVTYSVTGFQT